MIIKSLELSDFRNYESLCIHFDRGVNILFGDNAQGKTNILEAIYVSATTKSHKSSKDKDIINFEKEEAHIRTCLEKDEIETRVDMHLRKSKTKGIAIDGVKIKKAKELLADENIKISVVAEKCGFQNHYYFSKVFKSETNMTPLSFRKLSKNMFL